MDKLCDDSGVLQVVFHDPVTSNINDLDDGKREDTY